MVLCLMAVAVLPTGAAGVDLHLRLFDSRVSEKRRNYFVAPRIGLRMLAAAPQARVQFAQKGKEALKAVLHILRRQK